MRKRAASRYGNADQNRVTRNRITTSSYKNFATSLAMPHRPCFDPLVSAVFGSEEWSRSSLSVVTQKVATPFGEGSSKPWKRKHSSSMDWLIFQDMVAEKANALTPTLPTPESSWFGYRIRENRTRTAPAFSLGQTIKEKERNRWLTSPPMRGKVQAGESLRTQFYGMD